VAAPNIVNVATITAKTALVALTNSNASLLTNANASNQVYKINNITYANYTGSVVTATASILRSSVTYYMVGTVTIPANSTLVVSGKDTNFYLEEGDAIQGFASANSAVSAVISYEIIS
jgi:hypothetical protein